MNDKFQKDNIRFSKTPLSKAQEMLKKREERLDPSGTFERLRSDAKSEKERREALKTKEKFEDTKIKKRRFGPLQGVVDLLTFNKTKSEDESGEKATSTDIDGLTLQDIIAPIDMEIDFNTLEVGEWYFRTFFISSYPRYVGPNWLSPIVNFEHSLRISTFYYPVDSKVVLQKLKRKIGEMEATLFSQMEGRKAVDPTMKVALTDAQQLQDSIAEGVEKYFHFGMYITIQSKDKEYLEKISKNVISTLASINVTAKPALLQQEQGFISSQPLGLDKLFITRNMDTTSLANTFPFVTSELTMDHGIMYGINQHNRSLVIFDRFDMENANSVVFATSGAGKSYYVKLEAIRSMMLGTEIIIIDPEREYEKLCTSVNGAYISFSQDKGDKMNPFELSGLGEGEDELRMKMLSLQGFMKLMLGKLNSVEMSILDRALILTYREKGITLDPATQKGATFPLLEDLYKVLKGMAEPEARSMSSRLERYIIGSAAGVFNERSTIELNNPFTVFSIRDMPEELRPMSMYLMLDYIWTKIRKDQRRRILIVDEAWYMMQNPDSAKFMYSIAKRARKYYLGLTTITQDVDDFIQNDMGRAIITNSSLQFLMKQSPTAVERLQRVFNLSQGECQYLLTAERGQGLFFAGQSHVGIMVVSSQAEHELITTDPKDLERMRNEGSVSKSIDELSQIYDSPAMHPIHDTTDHGKSRDLRKAVATKKINVEKLVAEKLGLSSRATDGAQDVNTALSDMQKNQLYGSITDQVVAAREEMNKGRTHLTPYGLVGDIVDTEGGGDEGDSDVAPSDRK